MLKNAPLGAKRYISMKKFLMLLVMIAIGLTGVEAQNYLVPKFKRKKEVREYPMVKEDRPVEVYFGGTLNFALGMQNSIKSSSYGYNIGYNKKLDLIGGDVYLGADYKIGKHFTTGLQAGYLFQSNGHAIPLSGVFKCYYGTPTPKHPCRFYNFVQVGPQFYMGENSHTVGMLAGAGVGLRLLVARSLRMELQAGYQMNMRRPKINTSGVYDVPEGSVSFKQYAHLAQFGINFYIF